MPQWISSWYPRLYNRDRSWDSRNQPFYHNSLNSNSDYVDYVYNEYLEHGVIRLCEISYWNVEPFMEDLNEQYLEGTFRDFEEIAGAIGFTSEIFQYNRDLIHPPTTLQHRRDTPMNRQHPRATQLMEAINWFLDNNQRLYLTTLLDRALNPSFRQRAQRTVNRQMAQAERRREAAELDDT